MMNEECERTERLLASLSVEVRRAILRTAGAVAQADSQITSQEEQALAVVADALDIEPVAAVPDDLFEGLADLDLRDRKLIYSCAAWLASADSITDSSEGRLLWQLSLALELDDDVLAELQRKVSALTAERRQYLPRSEQLPWWEEFGELVRRLLAETTG